MDPSGESDPLVDGAELVDGEFAIQFPQLGGNDTLTVSGTGTGLGRHFADRLTGNAGANTLTGRGADTFVFTSANFTAAQNGGASTIADYDQGNSGGFAASEGDLIDVSATAPSAFDACTAADGLALQLRFCES